MKKITKDNYLKTFIEKRYRDLVLKPALKLINKHQAKSKVRFWTMPYDTICKTITLNNFYEIEILQGMCEIVKNKDGVVLDVGANIGNHSLYFAKVFNTVISFEPVPSNCWILQANAYLNKISNLKLIQKGLSNKNIEMAVDISNRENTNNGVFDPNKNSENQIIVDVVIGDEEIEKLNLNKKIEMIKIDVEGYEPFVVEGLKRTIQKDMPIIFWEAFSKHEANKTKHILEEMGYKYFYHLTPNKFGNKFINKLLRAISKATYIEDFDECEIFDGMNVASNIKL
jgi:FkbM family methyltransferase